MIKFPFTSMQQFNLDWIMEHLHKMLQFMPMNGVAGDVLQRTVDGAAWMPLTSVSLDIHSMSTIPEVEGADELAIYDNSLQGNYKGTVADILALVPASPVSSVNGQTGTVVLSIPSDTSDLTNGAGFVDAAGAAAAAPVQSVNGQTGAVIVSGGAVDSVNGKTGTVVLDKTDIGLGNVANVAQYSASNPPPYPVTSVNGQTGDVIVTGGSGFTATLLWSNNAVLNSFADQTLAIDLTNYSWIIVEFIVGVYTSPVKTVILPVPTLPPPTGYSTHNELQGMYMTGSNTKLAARPLEISTSGISFNSAYRVDSYNNSNTSDDTLCRPTRIWGIE